jgi:hypothetical protein
MDALTARRWETITAPIGWRKFEEIACATVEYREGSEHSVGRYFEFGNVG